MGWGVISLPCCRVSCTKSQLDYRGYWGIEMTSKQYETIEVERHDKVVLVTLRREPALNALNKQLTDEVIDALSEYDQNPEIGCFVLTGKGKAFAAGAISKRWPQNPMIRPFMKICLQNGICLPE